MAKMDTDGSGNVDFNEFLKHMVEKTKNFDFNANKLFQIFDTDKSGKIGFFDIKRVCTELGENFTD